jgi:hypothetical protein
MWTSLYMTFQERAMMVGGGEPQGGENVDQVNGLP